MYSGQRYHLERKTMNDFDTVIRDAHVATASDTFRCDIGIRGGRIAAPGAGLSAGGREIDAGGRWVLPGGIDTHCHFNQPMPEGVEFADDFRSGSISAVHGGTTTIVPFAPHQPGGALGAR